MNRQNIQLVRATESIRRVAPRFPIHVVGIFGSVARGEAGEGSDLDVVALFDEQRTVSDVIGFHLDLEDDYGAEVDLISSLSGCPSDLASELKKDLVIAYER